MKEFNLAEINPTISRVKVKIAYPGKNRKKFEFDKSVLENMIPTLRGTPILAYYSEKFKELGGHEGDIAKTSNGLMKTGKLNAYGFVDPVVNPWFEMVKEKDGRENEYLTTYAYLWTERFPKETKLIEDSGQSMEISIIDANMVDGYIKTKMAHFIGLTALNKDGITPTFESSKFEAFSSEDVQKELEYISQEISKVAEFAKGEDKSTPAKPEERIKGSDKNKEGSASNTRGGIKVSEKTQQTLKNKLKEHNDKYEDEKGKKVTLGMLKAVYRRGAGAYSTSHRSNVSSRDQWAIARVNAFLKLVSSGKPSDSDYTQDNDLLPKGHPKKTTKMSIGWIDELVEEISEIYDYECTDDDLDDLYESFSCEYEEDFAVPEKYEHINFKPPIGVAKAAQRGLNLRDKQLNSNKCCTAVGLARARQLINRQQLSPSTIKRMKSYFDRHEVDKSGEGWGKDSKGYQAWLIWGGDAGYRWAKKIVAQIKKADDKAKMSIQSNQEFSMDEVKVSTEGKKAIDGTVGEKDIGAIKKKVLKSSNKKEIIPKVFARYPDVLSDEINEGDLGYPLMSERDGVLYYNLGFIRAASSRIEAQKDQPYYSKVRENIVKARKKVGLPEEFTMKGDVVYVEYGMMKDMYAKYGMDKYMFAKMDDAYMYAMDMEEMKPVKMAYEMKEEMAVPSMDKVEMADDMMDKEDMAKMLRLAHEMYMKKMHGYMSLEEEKEALSKEKDGLFSTNQELSNKVKDFEEKQSQFLGDVKAFTIEKNKLEATKLIGHEDFSVLTEEDKKSLLDEVCESTDMAEFKTKVEAFSFRKAKENPKGNENDVQFSVNPEELVIKNKEEDKPLDLYERIKKDYFGN